jgi:Spy/CpxP family protein refolding chaperone
MNVRLARIAVVGFGLWFAAGVCAFAQNRGSGAPPPPPPPPQRGPNGPGNSGGPQNGNNSGNQSSANASASNTGSPTRAGLGFGPPGRWWDDKSVTKSIGLRSDQQKKMDTIFDANKSTIVSSYTKLMAEQAKLDALNKQPQANSAAIFATIDAVNQARSSLQKATTEMLLQIRSSMDADQIQKLQKIQ